LKCLQICKCVLDKKERDSEILVFIVKDNIRADGNTADYFHFLFNIR
jgi:hypothetical protein